MHRLHKKFGVRVLEISNCHVSQCGDHSLWIDHKRLEEPQLFMAVLSCCGTQN